jgi:hypothetical protein
MFIMKKNLSFLFASTVVAMSSPAFAAGGLAAGTTGVTDFKNWIYAILAIGAVIYMLVQCLMAWGNKITWTDVLHASAKVAVTGGAPALCTYLYGVFA